MKWKTAIYLVASLLYVAISVIVIDYFFGIQPFIYCSSGFNFYFDTVGILGIFPLWIGFIILFFIISWGKCEWCGELRGKPD